MLLRPDLSKPWLLALQQVCKGSGTNNDHISAIPLEDFSPTRRKSSRGLQNVRPAVLIMRAFSQAIS